MMESRGACTRGRPVFLQAVNLDDRGVKIDKAKAIKLFPDLVLMTDLFAACIETQTLPVHGSPCHRLARKFVEDSGIKPKRKRRPLPTVKSKEGQK